MCVTKICPTCKTKNPETEEFMGESHWSVRCRQNIGVKYYLFGLIKKLIFCNQMLEFGFFEETDYDDYYEYGMTIVPKHLNLYNMDNQWNINNVKAGMYVMWGKFNPQRVGLCMTRVFKVTYMFPDKGDGGNIYGLCNVLTDGWVMNFKSKDLLVQHLNAIDQQTKYYSLSKENYLKLINDITVQQGDFTIVVEQPTEPEWHPDHQI